MKVSSDSFLAPAINWSRVSAAINGRAAANSNNSVKKKPFMESPQSGESIVFVLLRSTPSKSRARVRLSRRTRTTITSTINPVNLHGVQDGSFGSAPGLGPRPEDPDLSEPLRWIPYRDDVEG